MLFKVLYSRWSHCPPHDSTLSILSDFVILLQSHWWWFGFLALFLDSKIKIGKCLFYRALFKRGTQFILCRFNDNLEYVDNKKTIPEFPARISEYSPRAKEQREGGYGRRVFKEGVRAPWCCYNPLLCGQGSVRRGETWWRRRIRRRRRRRRRRWRRRRRRRMLSSESF